MFDLLERAGRALDLVPVPLPGRVMMFAGPGGVPMVRDSRGAVRAAGGALVCRGAGALVLPDAVGVIQPFGGVDLAAFGAAVGPGTFVEVDAPLFARLAPGDAGTGCDIDLFMRVNGGDWNWWDATDIAWGEAGAWRGAGLSVTLVAQGGYLWSFTGSARLLELPAGGGGLVEWGCKLQRAVAQVQPVGALVKVW